MLQDLKMYKAIWNENRLFSFRVVRCSLTPGYLNTTHEKKAGGAAGQKNPHHTAKSREKTRRNLVCSPEKK